MKISIPDVCIEIIDALEQAGYDAYLIGGSVRDLLCGKTPFDYDFTTSATPDQIKEVFQQDTVFTQGQRYGTIGLIKQEQHFEITTFRRENEYIDYRRPSVISFTKDLKEDVMRRDFTMNALAFHPKKGVIDLVGGLDDIHSKIIRTVGDPYARFGEDALRILRAIRFALQTDFTIEKKTRSAMEKQLSLLKNIAIERIRDEIFKCFYALDTQDTTLLAEVLVMLFPSLSKIKRRDLKKIFSQFHLLPQDIAMYLSLLFSQNKTDSTIEELKNFKLDNQTYKETILLHEYLGVKMIDDSYFIKRMLQQLGSKLFINLLHLKLIINQEEKEKVKILEATYQKTHTILENQEPFLLADLAIDGNDIMQLKLKNAPLMKEILGYLLDEVMEDERKNTKEHLLRLVREKYQNK